MKTLKDVFTVSLVSLAAIGGATAQVNPASQAPKSSEAAEPPQNTPIVLTEEMLELLGSPSNRNSLEEKLNQQLPVKVSRNDIEKISFSRRFYLERLYIKFEKVPFSSEATIDVMTNGISRQTCSINDRKSACLLTVEDYARDISFRHLNGGKVKVKKILLMYTDSRYGRRSNGNGYGSSVGGYGRLPRCGHSFDEAGDILNDVADLSEVLRDHAPILPEYARYLSDIIITYTESVVVYETGGVFKAREPLTKLLGALDRAEPWFRLLVLSPHTQEIGMDIKTTRASLRRVLSP